ncbi:MAG TPA: hypothetical protein VN514_07680, partial [Ignavibacteria bacterium]|nr:hypothetical protein [Ignavibacteria bacterium]
NKRDASGLYHYPGIKPTAMKKFLVSNWLLISADALSYPCLEVTHYLESRGFAYSQIDNNRNVLNLIQDGSLLIMDCSHNSKI